jgi:hypothetical protein
VPYRPGQRSSDAGRSWLTVQRSTDGALFGEIVVVRLIHRFQAINQSEDDPGKVDDANPWIGPGSLFGSRSEAPQLG